MTEKLLTGTLKKSRNHYANLSVQYTAIFHGRKNGNYQMKKCERRSVLTENIRFNNHPEDSWYTGGVLSASLLSISQPISESMCVSDKLEISYDMIADFSGYN